MKFGQLMRFIPETDLEFLAAEMHVDYQVKKLPGAVMFKLILYSLLETSRPSLRTMEAYFNSAKFKVLASTKNDTVKFNSISERLTNINSDYFEKVFNLLFSKFNTLLKEEKSLQRYDSTMVGISSKLVEWGMKVGSKTDKVQMKFTVGMQGSLPCCFKVFEKQQHLSEDKTIPKVILDYKAKTAGMVVFDRGVHDRDVFTELSNQNVVFVTRLNTNANYKQLKKRKIKTHREASVQLSEDLEIFFIKRVVKKTIEVPFRLIKGKIKETGEEIYFLTNNFDLNPYEIAQIYKQRWEIEVFFKYLKQELNLSHFMNRSLNGIKVMVYMTLILSILLIVYKKSNKMAGFKIPKLKAAIDLQNSLLREIVILSGGNPYAIPYLVSDS